MPVTGVLLRGRLSLFGLAAVLSFGVCSQGCAENPPRPSGPPRAAVDACFGKPASEICYFEDRQQAITGTCQERGPDWVCVPDRAPPDGPDGSSSGFDARSTAAIMPPPSASGSVTTYTPKPPREAFEACQERAAGSVCIVPTPRGEVAGRCASAPYGLACIPTDPDHRPGEEANSEFSRR